MKEHRYSAQEGEEKQTASGFGVGAEKYRGTVEVRAPDLCTRKLQTGIPGGGEAPVWAEKVQARRGVAPNMRRGYSLVN